MLDLQPTPAPTASKPFRLSPSSIKLFQSCPRKFYHRYYNSIESKAIPDDSLQFGTAIHAVIEANINKPAGSWRLGEAVVGLDADLGALVAGTAAAYAVYWGKSLTYRAAELELDTPLRDPRLRLVTVLDGLATDNDVLVVVDHKSSKSDISPGSWFWEKLTLDAQASAYIWAARENGYAVEHAVWDAIAKPKLRRMCDGVPAEYYSRSGKWGDAGSLKPGTGVPAETVAGFAKRVRDTLLLDPTAYFQRAPVVRLDSELAEAVAEIEQVGDQILRAWDNAAWPRNPNSCMAFGRKCEFLPICDGSSTAADDTLYRIRKPRGVTNASH